MKNKFLYLILSMIMCFSFVSEVFALDDEFSSSVTINGGKDTFEKGKEAIININIKDNFYIDLCTFDVETDSGLEFLSSKTIEGYSFETNDGSKFIIKGSDTDATSTNGNLLQLIYKVNSSGKFKVNYSCEHKSEVEDKRVTHGSLSRELELKVIDLSQDTTLSKLVVNGGVLSQSFLPNVKNYSINLDSTSFSLNLTTSNPDYQDDIVVTDGDGNKLDIDSIIFKNTNSQGQMQIVITVNNDTVYNLLVVYEKKELDNSLKTLKVDGKNIQLEDGKYDYIITIGSDVNSVKIEASLKDSTNFKFIDEFDGVQIVQTPSSSTSYPIIIEPSNLQVGAEGVTYTIKFVKEKVNTGVNNGDNNQNVGNNTDTNPTTGGVSMAVMILILMCSLVGSIVIYQKNIENYNNK